MSQGAIHALSAFVINEVASLSTRSCPLHSLVWEGLSHALGNFQQLLCCKKKKKKLKSSNTNKRKRKRKAQTLEL